MAETVDQCRNCKGDLPENALYCPTCGQKRTDGKVTVGELFREFIDSVFNIDSRFIRTFGMLFIPGGLTIQYFQGRHKRFAHPIRVFLLSTILLLAIFSLTFGDIVDGANEIRQGLEKQWITGELLDTFDVVQNRVKEDFTQNNVDVALDSFNKFYKTALEREDSIDINEGIVFFDDNEAPYPTRIATRDIFEMEIDTLIRDYGVTDFWGKIIFKQQIKFRTHTENFISSIIGLVSWMILIMMPFLALVIKLFYIRRSFYFVEHLIFSFHVHSFLFLLLTIALVVSKWWTVWVWPACGATFLIYLPWAMKRVYKQGWFKTILKFILISNVYLFLLSTFIVLTVMIGFFLF